MIGVGILGAVGFCVVSLSSVWWAFENAERKEHESDYLLKGSAKPSKKKHKKRRIKVRYYDE